MSSSLSLCLDAFYGYELPGGVIEMRYRLTGGRQGMGRMFVPVGNRAVAERLIRESGERTDVYVGVAPRRPKRGGGRDAIDHVHVLWVDCDTEDAAAALRRFQPSPAIVVASGTPGHFHAYWPICPPVGPDAAEQANRRLAHHLGADPRSTDAARILRPPDTLNHKLDPPAQVEVVRLHVEVFDLDQVVAALPDPPEPRRRLTRAPALDPGDDLLAIPPAVYVEALTGQQVGRDGKIACPFHDDRTPSLHVYDDAEGGWCCFGCGAGGTIVDFGAHLFGMEPRGAGYHEIRRRVAEQLLASAC